ncbi:MULTISPECIES: MarR family winged helix-turn-helix transcriptional regulator [unclassified Rathayibacter]|uniref:MarR family winged helix-turn-helix transcriptional regulator n=1 Tax=unclassified Rathayibacter TaxID=2609250 RepID=UPI000F4C0640|nr:MULTISPECIES: MarR family transcriptional regulator [unclassified Rathayibacter]MCJ1705535.1 MarR family transcriptional regulator [Rathayibacter sp. VKM Ac-2926]ROP50161.1 DNA-binding MarR family transcriptional regulator [Rathayibacter sp. PhB186]ROS53119.1 DNA-binding MarR family transcriptional regulator [Rathayibacter sp. PhB185]
MTAPLSEQDQLLWHAWKIAADQVRQRVAEEIKTGTGLSDPDFGILTRLVELGGGELRQSDLATSMQWHRSRLSHQLTRMEQRGLLGRRSVDAGVHVQITDEGRDVVRAARPIHAAAVRRHLVDRTDGIDRATLMQVLERLAQDSSPSR